MKVSEIKVNELYEYCRVVESELTDTEKTLFNNYLAVAKKFISSYTGLTPTEIDKHDDFIIVVYILVEDMYDNRQLYVDKNNLNKVVETILGMHSNNLL